ncbi:putative mucin family signaling protein [Phaeoacremonium minimum UCRPA7]|uniref:Putative mucin family signaling protein n=1 Tax=Phaeoacremonium minimum (strain UCR-PA7) TaxID=1286976 RepID=R8BE08_PHAM7|nr:putative mucin family signaling protein [Phaeoacremonium minimum UCRPA7]EON97532.1 putative mucin family signaling protein [Phaeoacremonium minimum UCRPA7]
MDQLDIEHRRNGATTHFYSGATTTTGVEQHNHSFGSDPDPDSDWRAHQQCTLSGGGLAPTTTGGLPTGIPRAITPNSGLDPIPDGSVEIQIGFKYGLNYQFVAENPKAAAQVLWSVPELLSHAGSFDKSKAQMRRLIPLDTSANYGFVTTLAIATYPKTLVDQLRLDIHAPNSRVYNNPNQLVYNVSELINPAIDIIVGSGVDGGATGTGGGSSSTSTSNPNGDVFNDNGSDQSSGKRGETVGIAMGAIVISVAYGTAMFIVARRYKRKKQGHRRASSISTPATSMRQTPSPVMGGALLSRDFSSYGGVAGGRDSHGSGRSNMNNSGRTAFISAPVAAENSLGWN